MELCLSACVQDFHRSLRVGSAMGGIVKDVLRCCAYMYADKGPHTAHHMPCCKRTTTHNLFSSKACGIIPRCSTSPYLHGAKTHQTISVLERPTGVCCILLVHPRYLKGIKCVGSDGPRPLDAKHVPLTQCSAQFVVDQDIAAAAQSAFPP